MATIMTKRGQLDNVVTYEHICDTVADMANINPSYVTLGSVCIVIKGENDDLEVYMADSKKEWKTISSSSGEGGSISSSGIHICAQDEYDSVTGMPTIEDPLSNTFYLTPGGDETNDLYNEWIWLEDDEEWEKFGSATTAISQSDWNQSNSSADDFIKNKPAIRQQANGGGIIENAATSASGAHSHAEGGGTQSTGVGSHAEGGGTTAFGPYSHAEGGATQSTGDCSHAEGSGVTASGNGSHAEGGGTTASGGNSHAEGESTTASGSGAHSEGGGTTASGNTSHAEGGGTAASGRSSHAEGGNTIASGDYSHAEGSNTTANHMAQHVFGMHNIPDSSIESAGAKGNYVEIVGNGLDTSRRSNARTLDWAGNEEVAGDVIAYGCGGANPISLADLKNQMFDVPIQKGTNAGSAQIKSYTSSSNNKTHTQLAVGEGAFAEGMDTLAYGYASHSEGGETFACLPYSHAEGHGVMASGDSAHAEGAASIRVCNISGEANSTTYTVSNLDIKQIFVYDRIILISNYEYRYISAVDISNNTITLNSTFNSENDLNNELVYIFNKYAVQYAHIEGLGTKASAQMSHAEGSYTLAAGTSSHAEGQSSTAYGNASHAEGEVACAYGKGAHAEGVNTLAYGSYSHAENRGEYKLFKLTGEANSTTYTYTGSGDPEVGWVVYRQIFCRRVTNVDTINKTVTLDATLVNACDNTNIPFYISGAFGDNSHVEGKGTIAIGNEQHVQGRYNSTDNDGVYAEIVGNGTAHDVRSNARTLDWNGNEEVAGDIVAYGCGGANPISLSSLKNQVDQSVSDVQVNGVSVVADGVANVPLAGIGVFGVFKLNSMGIAVNNLGEAYIQKASSADIKAGSPNYKAIVPNNQHESAFYGLAKAAGDTTQSLSSNAVGTYTSEAKAAIKDMLGITEGMNIVTVSGTAPTINAASNTQYLCGEVLSLNFTPSATGICDVIFTSGSTQTVLTIPATVKMPEWFEVEANKIYEISITNGVYGAVMVWENA